jgi:hypothetical protein
MVEFSREWLYWMLINGIPGIIATILLLVYPPFDKKFSWDIEHRQSGIFFATGFGMRIAFFVAVVTANTWEEIRWIVWGNLVFDLILLGIPLIYGELLNWRRFTAMLWLFLYIEEPVWMLSLVPQAEADAVGISPLPGGEIHPLLQSVLWVEVLVMLAAGVYLFLMPGIAEPRWWPWRPDLLSARIMAGFALAWAVWAATLALVPAWAEARRGVLVNIIWLGTILVSLVIYKSHFDVSRRTTRIYGGVIAALFAFLSLGYFLNTQMI